MPTTVVLPGNYESLDKICHFVDQIARAAGFDDAALYAIETAVDEAFSNIIDHAYGGENKGEVECSCSCDPACKSLTVVLHDHGKTFDPGSIPEPNIDSSLEDRHERGLGLYFIRKLMDEVHFEFSREHGNTLTLVKHKEEKG